MHLIEKTDRHAIWHDPRADEYFVYHGEKHVRTCPSIGMAREVAAGDAMTRFIAILRDWDVPQILGCIGIYVLWGFATVNLEEQGRPASRVTCHSGSAPSLASESRPFGECQAQGAGLHPHSNSEGV